MADLSAAVLVVASLCMPPSLAESTGHARIIETTVIGPALPVHIAGFAAYGEPLVAVKVEYWLGRREPRFFSTAGYTNVLESIIRSSLPKLPDCTPVG